MSKSRKILAGAMLSALAIGALSSSAQAGDGHRHKRFHFDYGYYNIYKPHFKGCWFFKKKYYHTGHRFWLKKYRKCRWGRY